MPGSHFSLRFLQFEHEPMMRIKAASLRCLGSSPFLRPFATRPCEPSEEAAAAIRPDWLSICIETQPKDCTDVGDGEARAFRCSEREPLLDRVLLRGRRCEMGDIDRIGGTLEGHREQEALALWLVILPCGCGMVIALDGGL